MLDESLILMPLSFTTLQFMPSNMSAEEDLIREAMQSAPTTVAHHTLFSHLPVLELP